MPNASDEQPVEVTVSDPVPRKEGPEGAVQITATVVDPQHPKRAATFGYIGVPGHSLAPVSIAVGPPPDLPTSDYVATFPSDVRDLPLGRWEIAARFRVEARLHRSEFTEVVLTSRKTAHAKDWSAEDRVFELFPDLRNDDSPAARRRLASMTRLATVAQAYIVHSIFGVKDPAAEIAREMGANPATVRSWIHRARKAGFIPDTQRARGDG
jgi:hypothetical protein